MPPVLSFIIPVRNDAQRLRRCLESIRVSVTAVPSEVIVADNGSTDQSADVARGAGARVLTLPDGRVAEVRNTAARAASGEFLAFVDADHELDRGWSVAAVQLLQDGSVTAVGAQYHAPADGTWVQHVYDLLRRHEPGCRDVDWLPSGNLVVRRVAFEGIGGFDGTLETCEDVDLCQRLKERGGRLVAADRLRSVHFGDPKTLGALFRGELWRGRDNLRVSLRGRLTLRSIPSLAMPLLTLMALALTAGGLALAVGGLALAAGGLGGWPLAAAGAATFIALAAVRAFSIVRHAPGDGRAPLVARAMAVALVYNLARALALVTRSGHDVRRRK